MNSHAYNCEVQFGQRTALTGMTKKQNELSLVSGTGTGSGGFSASQRKQLMTRTRKKTATAIMERYRSSAFRLGECNVGAGLGSLLEDDEQIDKIDAIERQTEWQHQNIADNRLDNAGESLPNNVMPTAI